MFRNSNQDVTEQQDVISTVSDQLVAVISEAKKQFGLFSQRDTTTKLALIAGAIIVGVGAVMTAEAQVRAYKSIS